MFHKYLTGAKAMLNLPTVIVDVTLGEGDQYEYLTEYTCYDIIGGVHVEELRFSSRNASVPEETLEEMKTIAKYAGINAELVD